MAVGKVEEGLVVVRQACVQEVVVSLGLFPSASRCAGLSLLREMVSSFLLLMSVMKYLVTLQHFVQAIIW